MSNLSLTASVQTCKFNTGNANRVQSDRFQNPNIMVCPTWNGTDLVGRQVCADSFYTKRAGCNLAADRVAVENDLRPSYSDYITLSTEGFRAPLYANTSAYQNSEVRENQLNNIDRVTGWYGSGLDAGNYQATCGGNSGGTNYARGMAEEAQQLRTNQQLQEGYISNSYRRASGNGGGGCGR